MEVDRSPLQGLHMETKMSETLNKGHKMEGKDGSGGQSDPMCGSNEKSFFGELLY